MLWQSLVMFSFARWCAWTKAEADNLRAKGFVVRFKSMNDPTEKAGLEVTRANTAAVLQFWGEHSGRGHGLADIDVMDLQTRKVAMVCTGAEVTDENFPAIFQRLLDEAERL